MRTKWQHLNFQYNKPTLYSLFNLWPTPKACVIGNTIRSLTDSSIYDRAKGEYHMNDLLRILYEIDNFEYRVFEGIPRVGAAFYPGFFGHR